MIASLVFNFIDTQNEFKQYTSDSISVQVQIAHEDPDFFSKWVFDRPSQPGSQPSPPASQIFIAVICYFQQFVLIGLGFLLLSQIVMQILFFWAFEHLKSSREKKLQIQFDYWDPLGEFGLNEWNLAMDRMYWGLALGLFIPLISALNQPSMELDVGQVMADFLLTILIVSPFLFTIYVRGPRRTAAKLAAIEESRQAGNEDAIDSFKRQTVWPFQRIKDKYGLMFCGFILLTNLSYPSPIPWLLDLVTRVPPG